MPRDKEDETSFLAWYEANKNIDGAQYTLQHDLYLQSGSVHSPILFDGQGDVTINCNKYLIVVESSVIIDNPNLTMKGSGWGLIMMPSPMSDLQLRQGTMDVNSDEEGSGVINFIAGIGKLTTPKGGNRFSIIARGQDVTGIHYNGASTSVTLSNLDMYIEGEKYVRGVHSFDRNVTIENCTIEALGDGDVFGVLGNGSINSDGKLVNGQVKVVSSQIHASSSNASAKVYSAFGENGTDSDSLSILEPSLLGIHDKLYFIQEQAYGMPHTIIASPQNTVDDLPTSVNVYVREQSSEESIIQALPVKWDTTNLKCSTPGVYSLNGTFDLDALEGMYINSEQVTPTISVICTPNNKMFLHGWEVLDETKLHVLLPYPYGANYMELQYSSDGSTFTTYTSNQEANLMPLSIYESSGLCGFGASFPLIDKTMYVRVKISGGSRYDGISPIWKIDVSNGKGNMPPEYKGGNGEGDRGGQDIDSSLDQEESREEDNIKIESIKEIEQEVVVVEELRPTIDVESAKNDIKDITVFGSGTQNNNKNEKEKIEYKKEQAPTIASTKKKSHEEPSTSAQLFALFAFILVLTLSVGSGISYYKKIKKDK